MISLKLSTADLSQLKAIAKDLLSQNLVMDVNLIKEVDRWNLEGDQIKIKTQYELNAKTKALHFSTIDTLIKEKYSPAPEIYSIPIVHMDWEQADLLAKSIQPA